MPASREELLECFANDPDDRAAFELLEEQLYMEADWPALADLYRRRLAAPGLAAHAGRRARIGMRLGQLCDERLGQADAAIAAYTEAVRLDPKLELALQHLRRLYAARSSWDVVLQICEQELAIADAAKTRARLYAEMGDIWKRELGDASHAETLYERARAETGEPAGDTASAAPPADAAPSDRIGIEAEVQDPAETPVVQSAWLAAARGDTDSAIAGLERALERDPDDVEAIDMLLSVLEGAERTQELTALLERRASLAADPETRGAVLARLGAAREELGDVAGARDGYERALEAHPRHPGAWTSLARLYRRTDAWNALRALLENGLEHAQPATRVDRLCELGALLETKLDEPEAALERFEQAAALDPDEARAVAALARLGDEPVPPLTMPDLDAEPAGAEQRSTRIVDVLERKLALREERGEDASPEARRLRLRIAELRAGALGEPAAAVEMLEPLVDDDASLVEAAPMLAGLYEQLARVEPLIDLAERAASLCRRREDRAFWRRRAADAARMAGEPQRAIDGYRALLDEDPNDHGARQALADLLRSRNDAEPLVAMLRQEVPRADAEREFDLQLELASLLADSGRDADAVASLVHLRRCLELEPGRDDLLDWALDTCARHGGALAQIDFVEHLAAQAGSPDARARLLARRGVLMADALAWSEEAAASWRAALVLDPEQALARERLAEAQA